jgi:phosphoserine phosphatase RsbU/P
MKTAQPNPKKNSLAVKLALLVIASTSAIFISTFSYNYWYSSTMLLRDIEKSAGYLTTATVHKIETVLQGVEKLPDFLAVHLENQELDKEELHQFISEVVSLNEEIFGSTVAYEPFAFDPNERFFSPYYYKDGENLAFRYLGGDDYIYFQWDWYLIPKELNEPVWSEPYFDEGGGDILMSTYSVPFYKRSDGKRIFQGVVTVDLSLAWLVDIIASVSLFESGYAFLISQNGVFVTHPKSDLIMNEKIFDLAEEQSDNALREIGRNMIRGKKGFAPYSSVLFDTKSWIYYAPLASTGWSIGVVFPEDELFADFRSLSQTVLFIGLAGFILMFIAIVLISGAITKPIRSLALTTAEIAKGNLDAVLPTIQSNDEVGELSRSFEDMRVALKDYISNLTETTAAKERIESELKIAHNIQMNFLPKNFPPFPEREEFEIYAKLEPAKEVGGDLYDFFLMDDERLFFAIGDVTDKGVPAALFMAVSKTLMKGIAEHGKELNYTPSDVLIKVNDELAQDNDSSMFVTVICCFLNFKKGTLLYSNAAHNQPVLVRPGKNPEWVELPDGFLLGPMMGMKYETRELQMLPGDILLLYTDGVDEANNVKQEFYTKQRILETVKESKADTAEQLVNDVMKSVKEFATGAPQSDDITLLAVRYDGPNR